MSGLPNVFATTPKLSDQEVNEGRPVREAFRNQVLADQKKIADSEPIFISAKISLKSIKNVVESELAWLNANVEVSKREIDSRKTVYDEFLSKEIEYLTNATIEKLPSLPSTDQTALSNNFPFEQSKKKIQDAVNLTNVPKEEEKNDESATQKAIKDSFKYLGIIIAIVIALITASLAVNENLWQPLPYRILIFIYTMIFFPIWFPYYIYKAIFPGDSPNRFESFFPVYSYDPTQPISFGSRLFGYPNTTDFCKWITEKRNDWDKQRLDTLKTA